MIKRSYKLYLKDILDSINKILEYSDSLSYEELFGNEMVLDAIIRNLEIIGEASKNVPDEIKALHNEIPWKEMAGMRDKVIHIYFGIDNDIIWETIKVSFINLPRLIESAIKA